MAQNSWVTKLPGSWPPQAEHNRALTLLVLQVVPGTGVVGEGGQKWNSPVCPSSHNGQTGLGQNTSAHSISAASRVATVSQSRGSTQVSTGAQGNAQNTGDPSALQCFRCQGWGHMARECATLSKELNKDRGTEEMQSNPHITQPVNSQHSLPDPDP